MSGKAVEGIIRFGLSTDETREDIGLEGTSVTARGIDFTNVDLDGSVVLSSDNTASGRAIYKRGMTMIK